MNYYSVLQGCTISTIQLNFILIPSLIFTLVMYSGGVLTTFSVKCIHCSYMYELYNLSCMFVLIKHNLSYEQYIPIFSLSKTAHVFFLFRYVTL